MCLESGKKNRKISSEFGLFEFQYQNCEILFCGITIWNIKKTIKLTKNFYIHTNFEKISMKTIFTTNLGWKSINFSNRISKIISISQKLIGKTDNFGLKIGLFLISLEISVFSFFSFFLRDKISFFFINLSSLEHWMLIFCLLSFQYMRPHFQYFC